MTTFQSILGTQPITRFTVRLTRRKLRVLAYHGVSDQDHFGRQLAYLTERYALVSGAEVVTAVRGGAELPDRALWITFDDGQRSVVEHGLPVLERLGAVATMFVCPGLIAESQPFWWSVVAAAVGRRSVSFQGRAWVDESLVRHLKTVPDAARREFVATLPTPAPDPLDQPLDEPGLRRWIDAGMELGNHTWDHPMLDQCSPESQRTQIERAHRYLEQTLGAAPTMFAYPNGNIASATRQVLKELGYELAVEFDHRLADIKGDPFSISRLRLDSDASIERTAAIASGAHSAVFALKNRLMRRSA
ncbi:polysaccharide deacetylase family protein [Candidatus Microthrix parvicella]|uniref:polysaccharide deacetylase family protein n=1 Tax=Candidatus Neomicrothrix parvicella TaxID=41950 RepID=UPI0003696023|nr:polysaccharide deacetylase family protein [Candidatus Microthrix parvicella]